MNKILMLITLIVLVLSAACAAPPPEVREVVTMVFLPGQAADIALRIERYGPMLDWVAEEAGVVWNPIVATSYEMAIMALCSSGSRNPTIVGLGPKTYIQARSICAVDVIVREEMKGSDRYSAVIIGQPGLWEDPFTFDQLVGRSFGFVSTGSTSGFVSPIVQLHLNGVELADFAEYGFLGSHPAVIEAVSGGGIEAGATYDSLLAQMNEDGLVTEGEDYELLFTSEPYYQNPFTVRADMDEGLKTRLHDAMIAVPQEVWDQCELITGFVHAEDADYESFAVMSELADELIAGVE